MPSGGQNRLSILCFGMTYRYQITFDLFSSYEECFEKIHVLISEKTFIARTWMNQIRSKQFKYKAFEKNKYFNQ